MDTKSFSDDMVCTGKEVLDMRIVDVYNSTIPSFNSMGSRWTGSSGTFFKRMRTLTATPRRGIIRVGV